MKDFLDKDDKFFDYSDSNISSDIYANGEYKGEFYGEDPVYIGIGRWTPPAVEDGLSLNENNPLSQLESAAVISVLEDATDELVILKYVIGTPIFYFDTRYKTPEERFTRRLTPERIFPEVDSMPILTPEVKLQKDREQIETVCFKLTRSLADDGTYFPLTYVLESYLKETADEMNLIQDLKQNLLYLKNLKDKVEEKRRLDDQEEKERDGLMYFLQDEMDDVILKCNVEKRFVYKWENIRQAQNQYKFRTAENYYTDSIAKLSTRTKLEKRVTFEIQNFLKIHQTELEEQLEEWMAQYDAETERRDNKIMHLKYSRDQVVEKKQQQLELYESRKNEIKEWLIFREIRKKKSAACLQIQSWWRGLMVRKKLGRYKGKKKKKRPGSKKTKKRK